MLVLCSGGVKLVLVLCSGGVMACVDCTEAQPGQELVSVVGLKSALHVGHWSRPWRAPALRVWQYL